MPLIPAAPSSSLRQRVYRLLTWLIRAFIVIFVWATFIEPQLVLRHDSSFAPPARPAWPAGCNGLKVAILSDLHVGDFHMHPWRRQYIERSLAETKPDLVLIPGDFVAHVMGGRTLPLGEIADVLQDWPTIAPVVAVLGNHDYSDQPPHTGIPALERHGIEVLNNESLKVSLRNGQCSFWIAGVADGFSGVDSVPATMGGIPEGEPVVMLTHDPRVALKADPSRVSWVIAGHAHGGVACVPGTHWCVSRLSKWTGPWVRGWYESPTHPDTLVSSGLGNSIYPGRIGAPPGWDLVELNISR